MTGLIRNRAKPGMTSPAAPRMTRESLKLSGSIAPAMAASLRLRDKMTSAAAKKCQKGLRLFLGNASFAQNGAKGSVSEDQICLGLTHKFIFAVELRDQ